MLSGQFYLLELGLVLCYEKIKKGEGYVTWLESLKRAQSTISVNSVSHVHQYGSTLSNNSVLVYLPEL